MQSNEKKVLPWMQGRVICEKCGHRWQGVRQTGTLKLECSRCHHMTPCDPTLTYPARKPTGRARS